MDARCFLKASLVIPSADACFLNPSAMRDQTAHHFISSSSHTHTHTHVVVRAWASPGSALFSMCVTCGPSVAPPCRPAPVVHRRAGTAPPHRVFIPGMAAVFVFRLSLSLFIVRAENGSWGRVCSSLFASSRWCLCAAYRARVRFQEAVCVLVEKFLARLQYGAVSTSRSRFFEHSDHRFLDMPLNMSLHLRLSRHGAGKTPPCPACLETWEAFPYLLRGGIFARPPARAAFRGHHHISEHYRQFSFLA